VWAGWVHVVLLQCLEIAEDAGWITGTDLLVDIAGVSRLIRTIKK
jgi:hypothetical protein